MDLETSVALASSNATLTITNGISLYKWHYVALTYTDDGDDEITLYIDGREVGASTNGNGAPAADSNDLLLGGDSSNNFHGSLDEFKIYPYERTTAQITTDFIQGTSSVHGISTAYGVRDYSYLEEGLVGYWKMDDNVTGDSQTIIDYSGYNSDGTTSDGNASLDCSSGGKLGQACNLDGSDDYISVTDSDSLDVADAITIAAWIRRDGTGSREAIIGKYRTSDSKRGYYMDVESVADTYGISFFLGDSDGAAFSQAVANDVLISSGEWYHVAGTWDKNGDGKLRVYVNGIEETSYPFQDTKTDSININDLAVWFGNREGTTRYFDGDIDDMRLYNRALSPSEIVDLYSIGGLIGYWSFDENTGTSTVYDRSGNGYDGTMDTTMTEDDWVPGKFGSALDFDGNNDNVTVNDNNQLDITGNFSVSAWVRRDAGAGAYILSKTSTSGSGGYGVLIGSAGEVYCRTDNGTSNTDSYTPISMISANSIWHHVGVVRNGTSCRVYIDGVDRTSVANSHSTSGVNGLDLVIGSRSDAAVEFWYGAIDEVKLYDYVRTPAQITEDMNAGHPAPGSPVGSALGHWKFDENYGDTANDSGTGGHYGDLAGMWDSCPGAGACPTWTSSGKFGNALDFDGSDDYVNMGDQSAYALERDSPITLEAWVTADADAGMSIISKMDNDSSDIGYQIQFGGAGKFFMQIINTLSTNGIEVENQGDLNYDDGNWHHVVATYDGSEDADGVKLYYDGEQLATTTNFNNLTGTILNDVGLRVGARNGTGAQYYEGKIDEAKIYNIELTPSQVKVAYSQGRAALLGAVSTDSSGDAVWSADRAHCPPGFTGTCDTPVAWWSMDENNGTGTDAVKDISGNDNHGDTNGSMTESDWVPGKHGSALELDGNNDYIDAGDINSVEGVSALTACAWFNTTDGDGGGLVGKNDLTATPSDRTWILYKNIASDTITFYVTNTAASWDAQIDGSTAVHDGKWHHVCGVYDGTNDLMLYIDGISEGTIIGTEPSSIRSNSQTVKMGVWDTSRYLNSLIDDIRIYDYALSQEQVAFIFNRGKPVAYYKLDEGTGTTANDSSGNNLTINTFSGDTSWASGKRNSALYFDGTSDVIYRDDTTNSPFDITEELTIAFWFNATQLDGVYRTILTKGDSGQGEDNNYYCTLDNANRVLCAIGNTVTTEGVTMPSDVLSTNIWYHVAFTIDGSKIKRYMDGVLDDEINQTITPVVNNGRFTIGAYSNGTYSFPGYIDDIKIYNYALTKQQLLNDYNQGAAIRWGPSEGSP